MSANELRSQWRRRARPDCGCTMPRCCRRRPSVRQVDAYAEAVRWLDAHGIPAAPLCPELDALRHRGGADAALADAVLRRWVA